VQFIGHGFREAWQLLLHPTDDLRSILVVTFQVAFGAAFLALLIGVPAGIAIGIGRFRGRRTALAFANSGFGLPPIVVGLYVLLLTLRAGPLGGLHLVYTVRGMIVAQTILDLPIVVALTAAATRMLDPGLLAQARALGASRLRVGLFTARESRNGIVVAALAAIGAGLSEVGAVVLVGGNILQQTRTAAGAILTSVSGGNYAEGIALGTLLLGAVFLIAAILTWFQLRQDRLLEPRRDA
jgi:tungstate transport system permease protein